MYRVVVATTLANLSDVNCRFTEPLTITLQVISCGLPLSTSMISFNGKVVNKKASLKWVTTDENEPLYFHIEKSMDGNSFTRAGTVNSYNELSSEQNTYLFTDPEPLYGLTYYRIMMTNARGQNNYSRIIQLSGNPEPFSLVSIINPFYKELVVDVLSVQSGKVDVEIIDPHGKTLRRKSFIISSGLSKLVLENTDLLPNGLYYLRIVSAGILIQKQVLKQAMKL